MGTNYYATSEECPCCRRKVDMLHIGKSSAGWAFTLRIDTDLEIYSWTAWKKHLKGRIIVDEYGTRITMKRLREIVELRTGDIGKGPPPRGSASWDEFAKSTGAVVDYDLGLLRHEPQTNPMNDVNPFCIAHGKGSWDLVVGEFC